LSSIFEIVILERSEGPAFVFGLSSIFEIVILERSEGPAFVFGLSSFAKRRIRVCF